MMIRRPLATVLPALLAGLVLGEARADCFRLYDREEQLIHQDHEPPFDIGYDPAIGPSAALRASQARGERLEIVREPCPVPISNAFSPERQALPGAADAAQPPGTR